MSTEANAQAQQWFLDHYAEVPPAKWYAVGPEGLVGHGEDLEALKKIVVDSGRSLADPTLLIVCLCQGGACCK